MDPTPKVSDRGLWAFWIACVLAAVGAVTPFLLSGGSTRVNGVLIPFAVGAVAFAVLAMVYHQGRPLATLLYFVASLAVVFGLLSLLALPLRLAVLGMCAGPGPCAIGLEPPITSSETTALGFAITIGIVSILTGFFGLRTQYHRHRMRRQAAAPSSPPARRIPPVGAKAPAEVGSLDQPTKSRLIAASAFGPNTERVLIWLADVQTLTPDRWRTILAKVDDSPEAFAVAAPIIEKSPQLRAGMLTIASETGRAVANAAAGPSEVPLLLRAARNAGIAVLTVDLVPGDVGAELYKPFQGATPRDPVKQRIGAQTPASRHGEIVAAVAESPAEPEPQAELPAHEPDPELPAHIAESKAEAGQAAPTPAPQRPRRQRKPKAPP
jgi:hypothetical protein